jgi:sterol desaturase/sphingolipid hydroxylase (fatty acid hydroxylase superfamily)
MSLGAWLADAAQTLTSPLVQILDQRNVFSYIGAAIFIFVAAITIRFRRRHHEFRLRAFWRLLTKQTIWRHKSSLLDYKLYLVNMPLLAFVLGWFIIGGAFWSGVFGDLLTRAFGPAAETVGTNWGIIAGITLFQLLAFDLGYWLGHAWMHRSEILWQFHKLHHSAEVMTPATEYRQHPVELILIPTVIALVTGCSFALVTHWFGTGAATLGVYGFNMIAVVHVLTFHHVRHSHIRIPFTGAMGVIFHSPAHHHLHHSNDPKHFNCNMGYVLSVWDWAAGTLHMPRRGERLTLGIGAEGAEHASVKSAFWVPFRDAGAVIARKRSLRRVGPQQVETTDLAVESVTGSRGG